MIKNKKDFIFKANKIHNNYYDYSNVIYIKSIQKVEIICPKHGVFNQSPNNHLRGSRCPKCFKNNQKILFSSNNTDFINKSILIHGTNYDYSLVDYINNKTKIKIICSIHGVFEQNPASHLKGSECIKCSGIEQLTTKDFIEKSNIIHNNFYNYSLVDYINNRTKVKIICPEHGEFVQNPSNHLRGKACMECYVNKKSTYKRKDINNFITEANKIHNNKYSYNNCEYVDRKSNVVITCDKHGDFIQRPAHHLRGAGCPTCTETKGEKYIRIFLETNNINFEQEKKFDTLKDKSYLYYDFYLPQHNICIEFDGKQHFEPIKYFGGEKTF